MLLKILKFHSSSDICVEMSSNAYKNMPSSNNYQPLATAVIHKLTRTNVVIIVILLSAKSKQSNLS
jgi:hypothetical protein